MAISALTITLRIQPTGIDALIFSKLKIFGDVCDALWRAIMRRISWLRARLRACSVSKKLRHESKYLYFSSLLSIVFYRKTHSRERWKTRFPRKCVFVLSKSMAFRRRKRAVYRAIMRWTEWLRAHWRARSNSKNQDNNRKKHDFLTFFIVFPCAFCGKEL